MNISSITKLIPDPKNNIKQHANGYMETQNEIIPPIILPKNHNNIAIFSSFNPLRNRFSGRDILFGNFILFFGINISIKECINKKYTNH